MRSSPALLNSVTYRRDLGRALQWAIEDAGRYLSADLTDRLVPRGQVEADRELLAALLTLRDPGPVPTAAARAIDALMTAEVRERGVVEAEDLPRIADSGPLAHVALWQGDITRLRIGGVVNAANSAMLGCRTPGHSCIDNAIHAASGPELRNACAEHMRRRRTPEPTGTATITPAFNLPAAAVIHTVGPIVTGRQPTAEDARLLASCYRACLDAAERAGLDSIALCSVSTGVFGYPIEQAAAVALNAVTQWLGGPDGRGMFIVFDTFSPRDTEVYRELLTSARAQRSKETI